jgi:hypothetical protein
MLCIFPILDSSGTKTYKIGLITDNVLSYTIPHFLRNQTIYKYIYRSACLIEIVVTKMSNDERIEVPVQLPILQSLLHAVLHFQSKPLTSSPKTLSIPCLFFAFGLPFGLPNTVVLLHKLV